MRKLLFFTSCLLILSCRQNTGETYTQGAVASKDMGDKLGMEPPRTAEPPAPPLVSEQVDPKIIKTGEISVEVNDLVQARSKLDGHVKGVKAYYENENYFSEYNRKGYRLVIRVPNQQFDTLWQRLQSGMGRVLSSNVNVSDVTGEYVDLNIRLNNNLAYLAQYKEVLKKAKSIEDIMAVQEKIRVLEEEIDSKKGRIQYLDDQVNYSTLTLEIVEWVTTESAAKPVYYVRVVNAFKEGIQLLFDFVIWMIGLWPFIILLGTMLVFRRKIAAKIRLVRNK